MTDRSDVHAVADDCEMHLASVPKNTFGDPQAVVVEPPTLWVRYHNDNGEDLVTKTWADKSDEVRVLSAAATTAI